MHDHKQQMFSPTRPTDTLEDIWDGSNVAENALFKSDRKSLGLILYQDAFEVANPLGSGKKKHKVPAVYFSLTDVAPHNRSNVDQMQLALLCREQDFKYFGHDKVFASLIRDLKDLEENGLVLSDGQVYRGTLCAIAGDNLGSHNIGGFNENFSRNTHFCRFCSIGCETFTSSTVAKASVRTAESYTDHVQQLSTSGLMSSAGIKFNSKFNDLSYIYY